MFDVDQRIYRATPKLLAPRSLFLCLRSCDSGYTLADADPAHSCSTRIEVALKPINHYHS